MKVAEVDEFVNKSGDAKANKAIMVSSSGFQKGCFEVAGKHGIDLFTVQEIRNLPDDLLESSFLTPALNIHNFALDCGGEVIDLPERRNMLSFLINNTFVESGRHRISIERIIDDLYFQLAGSDRPRELEVGFDTAFKSGSFYVDVHTEFCYFCHRVEGDLITLTMLEGYQHGQHLQVTFSVLRENAKSYVEITDKVEVERLKAMLRTLRNMSGSNSGGEEILDS